MSPIGTNTVTLSDFHESVPGRAIDAELGEAERTQPDGRENDRADEQHLACCLHETRLPGNHCLEPAARPMTIASPSGRTSFGRRAEQERDELALHKTRHCLATCVYLDPASTSGDREHEHGDAEHRGDHYPEHPHEVEEAELEVHAHDPCEHRRG